jgi:hypothetical protein
MASTWSRPRVAILFNHTSSACRICCSRKRAEARSPPSISIEAATGSSQFGAPGCAAPILNHLAASGMSRSCQ